MSSSSSDGGEDIESCFPRLFPQLTVRYFLGLTNRSYGPLGIPSASAAGSLLDPSIRTTTAYLAYFGLSLLHFSSASLSNRFASFFAERPELAQRTTPEVTSVFAVLAFGSHIREGHTANGRAAEELCEDFEQALTRSYAAGWQADLRCTLLQCLHQSSHNDLLSVSGSGTRGRHPCDLRATYCVLSCARYAGIVRALPVEDLAVSIATLQNIDGGFGGTPGAESHGAYTYLALVCLVILTHAALEDDPSRPCTYEVLSGLLDLNACVSFCLGLCAPVTGCDHRFSSMASASGLTADMSPRVGLRGRLGKAADACMHFWVLSAIVLCTGCHPAELVDRDLLLGGVVACFDADTGGFAREPGLEADPLHTFCASIGLAILFGPVWNICCCARCCDGPSGPPHRRAVFQASEPTTANASASTQHLTSFFADGLPINVLTGLPQRFFEASTS